MQNSELKNLASKLVGARLDSVLLACEMMRFYFGNQYAIHATCFTRIIKNDDILVTTLDYQSWDEETSENNDEWYFLNKFKPQIEGGVVTSVEISPCNDLTITLNNGIVIQIMILNGYFHYGEENEQYRIFEFCEDEELEESEEWRAAHKHCVVCNKSIELQ